MNFEKPIINLGYGYTLDSAYVAWLYGDKPTPYRLTFVDDLGSEVEITRWGSSVSYNYSEHGQELVFEAWLERVADTIASLGGPAHWIAAVEERQAHWHEAAYMLIINYLGEHCNAD